MNNRRNTARSRLEKQLDDLWSQMVKRRDTSCRRCNYIHRCNERIIGVEAHHIYGRANRGTRWDVRNGTTLCESTCHPWAERHPAEFEAWIIDRIGQSLYDELGAQARKVTKHTVDDLQEMKNNLRFFLT